MIRIGIMLKMILKKFRLITMVKLNIVMDTLLQNEKITILYNHLEMEKACYHEN